MQVATTTTTTQGELKSNLDKGAGEEEEGITTTIWLVVAEEVAEAKEEGGGIPTLVRPMRMAMVAEDEAVVVEEEEEEEAGTMIIAVLILPIGNKWRKRALDSQVRLTSLFDHTAQHRHKSDWTFCQNRGDIVGILTIFYIFRIRREFYYIESSSARWQCLDGQETSKDGTGTRRVTGTKGGTTAS